MLIVYRFLSFQHMGRRNPEWEVNNLNKLYDMHDVHMQQHWSLNRNCSLRSSYTRDSWFASRTSSCSTGVVWSFHYAVRQRNDLVTYVTILKWLYYLNLCYLMRIWWLLNNSSNKTLELNLFHYDYIKKNLQVKDIQN